MRGRYLVPIRWLVRQERTLAVYGDPSAPASATITMTHRLGRVLGGVPLALAVFGRRMLFLGLEDGLAPQYLHLRDKATGVKIARLGLGRDPYDAVTRREIVERDLDLLSREQFLSDHVRRWERY